MEVTKSVDIPKTLSENRCSWTGFRSGKMKESPVCGSRKGRGYWFLFILYYVAYRMNMKILAVEPAWDFQGTPVSDKKSQVFANSKEGEGNDDISYNKGKGDFQFSRL